jgi:hypothetical protein
MGFARPLPPNEGNDQREGSLLAESIPIHINLLWGRGEGVASPQTLVVRFDLTFSSCTLLYFGKTVRIVYVRASSDSGGGHVRELTVARTSTP